MTAILNQGLIVLPIVIVVHFIIGVIASIKAKAFDIKKMPDFIVKALMFMGFVTLLDYIYKVFVANNMGAIAIAGLDTLRGLAWLAIIVYYVAKIYKNLVYLGMPKMKPVEDNLNQNDTIDSDKQSIFCVKNDKEDK
jgi:phage-related holin